MRDFMVAKGCKVENGNHKKLVFYEKETGGMLR